MVCAKILEKEQHASQKISRLRWTASFCWPLHLSTMNTWELLDDVTQLKGAIFELQRKVQVMEDRLTAGDLGTSYHGRWEVLVCVFRNSGEPTTQVVLSSNDMNMSVFREQAGIPHDATILCPCPTGQKVGECGIRHFVAAMEAGYKPESGLHINVVTLTKKKVPAPIHERMDVAAIRHYVTLVEGIPQEQQRLLFNGRVLDNCMRLYDYGIRPGDKVDLVLRLKG